MFTLYADVVAALLAFQFGSVWTVGQAPEEATGLFVGDYLTTLTVCEALRMCRSSGQAVCNTPESAAEIDSDLSYAETAAGISNFSDPAESMDTALIARYFGQFSDDLLTPYPPLTINVDSIFEELLAQQHADGSWNDTLVTAVALQAIAGWLKLDAPDQDATLAIDDARLRRAVNSPLGNAAMDAITRSEVRQRLETLDASYAPIADLSVLADASNLKTIDISGNPCLVNDPNVDQTLMQLFPGLQTVIKRPVGDVNRDGFANSADYALVATEVVYPTSLSADGFEEWEEHNLGVR